MGIPVTQLDQFGFVYDRKPYTLPVNAWSDARNVRLIDGSVYPTYGHQAILGIPRVPAYHIHGSLDTTLVPIFAYCGLEDIYATDGVTHTEITRAAGVYTGTEADIWNSCDLGSVTIFNNGIDVPQYWASRSLGTQLVDLPNWPAGYQAKVVRAFGRFLFAWDITISGTHNPHLFKWSHPADPGSIPASWDYADETRDAGEYPLMDTPGRIMDGLALGDNYCIYKSDCMYIARYIGGTYIFDLPLQFKDFGILSQRAVGEWRKKHVVASEDNVFIHDGFKPEPLLQNRTRRWLAARIDPTNAMRTFIAINHAEDEAWICFPEQGEEFCTQALVVNLHTGAGVPVDLPDVAHIDYNKIPAQSSTTFDSQTTPFDSMVGYFGQSINTLTKKRMVACSPKKARNYLRYSSELDNAEWTKTNLTVSADADTDPELTTLTIDRLVPTNTNGPHVVFQSRAKNAEEEISIHLTGRFKADGYDHVVLIVDDGSTNIAEASFNLATGVISNIVASGTFSGITPTMTALDDDYWRCTLLVNTGPEADVRARIYVSNNGTTANYAGDTVSGVLVGGLELREGPLSVIHTETEEAEARSAIFLLDSTYAFDGVPYTAFIERTGLAVSGQNRDGSARVDPTINKFFQAIWPKVELINGDSISVIAGGQDYPEGPVNWNAAYAFNPDEELFVDVLRECRYEAIRFEATAGEFWRLSEYDLEIVRLGRL